MREQRMTDSESRLCEIVEEDNALKSVCKLCKDCEYFKIKEKPLKMGGHIVDLGTAICKKHDLITHFTNLSKFNSLSCIERKENGE